MSNKPVLKTTPEKELQQLKPILNKLNKQRVAVSDRIDELETQLALPDLKKKYKGKYFRYKNSYSSDKWWWLFIYISDVLTERVFVASSFQITVDGKCEFRVGEKMYYESMLENKITKSEYTAALKRFKAKLNQL